MEQIVGKSVWVVGLIMLLGGALTFAQAPPVPPGGPPLPGDAMPDLDQSLNIFDQMGGGFGDPLGGRVEFTGSYRMEEDAHSGRLLITARIQPDWHLYSTTQPDGGPRPTQIQVAPSPAFKVVSEFRPDLDPEIHDDPAFPGVVVEEHVDEVTWTANIRLVSGEDPESLRPEVTVNCQVCQTGGSCELISEPVDVPFGGFYTASRIDGQFHSEGGHVTIRGQIEPRVTVAGGSVRLKLEANIAPGWHIYGYAPTDPKQISKPTLIVLRKTAGWVPGEPEASVAPVRHDTGLDSEPVAFHHESTVSWTLPIEVPENAKAGEYEITGYFGFQACTPSSCDAPTGLEFRTTVAVGTRSDDSVTAQLAFTSTEYGSVAKSAAVQAERKPAQPQGEFQGTWGDKSVATVLGLAFLAGLVLNVMPCVLPVIGLKIMSFVQQAGGSRWEIFSLNLWFSFGLMFVFWILATAAAFANMGWGEHFGKAGFTVSIIGIVFAFGLSFLGVWEIPIPGFVGTGSMQAAAGREGAVGAFSKGVLTTILATPCAGPLLVPAVSWATAQPAWLTYLAFTAIGFGMATPYLLIGAFPSLINLLPKPGAWMDTFKQAMGFLLMGTVIFLFGSVTQEMVIPTLILLLGIGIACWWVNRTPATAALADRLKAWGSGSLVIAAAAVIGFIVLVPRHELAWEPFDRVSLEQHLEEGRTVLVDFTAHW